MLTRAQARAYNRFKKLGLFFEEETTAYSSFVPFATEVAHFNANLQELEGLVPGKMEIVKGITMDKAAMKQQVANSLALICRKTRAYALRFNQPELAAQTRTHEDKIFKMKDADIMGYATSIVNLLTPLLPNADYIPYGITAGSLDTIASLAAGFNDLIGKARQSDSGNAVTNTAINHVIDLLRTNVSNFNLLVDEFETDNPGFVQAYRINSSVDNVGIRHSGIEGTVRNSSGEVIAHATIQLDGTDKKAVTNLQGIYRLDRVAPDDYVVNVSASGYTSQQAVHRISRGKMDELDFHLAV